MNVSSQQTAFELFPDTKFGNGFWASTLAPSEAVALLPPQDTTGIVPSSNTPPSALPSWRLSQWASRHDIKDAARDHYIPNPRRKSGPDFPGLRAKNAGKTVIWDEDGSVYLRVNGGAEYERPRLQDQPWVHLLLEPGDLGEEVLLSRLQSLRYRFDVRLDQMVNLMEDSDFQIGHHTAQLPSFFVLKNINPRSADYGDMIWFGIPVLDYRRASPDIPSLVAVDEGTRKLMVGLAGSEVWDRDVRDGHWHSLDIELAPRMIEALDTAHEEGFLLSSTPNDIAITAFNWGWEVPGTFTAAVSVRGLSAEVVLTREDTDA